MFNPDHLVFMEMLVPSLGLSRNYFYRLFNFITVKLFLTTS